jgi:hypothetical protein
MYDPATNTWETKAPMSTARKQLTANTANGKIYAIGGSGATNNALNIVEEYDPLTNTWSNKATMPGVRTDLLSVSIGNEIYILGNNERVVQKYIPLTETWSFKSEIPEFSSSIFAVAESDGKIYAVGAGTDNAKTYEYDPLLDQ